MTGKEIAEAIWLASQTDAGAADAIDVPVIAVTETVMTQDTAEPLPLDLDLDEDTPPLDGQADIVPAPVEQTPSLALPPNYKPIPVPDAPAISQALQLARALRPLARQIAVGLPSLMDEDATVNLIAETRVWQPVLKPESELWLDVALVFDTSPSMCLWQRFGADLHRLLARYGEFRDVRVWLLKHTAGTVSLTARNGIAHKPSELLIGDRRRLVVIVSDCVAPAWHNGKMRKLIATWSAKLPTVVFHVFPERLWSRTALARSVTAELQGKRPGLPSNHLQPFARSVWDRERLETSLTQYPVRLPVVTLEPDVVSGWARVVAGDRHARVLGIVWDAQPVDQSASMHPPTESASALKERIDSFVLFASPISRDLAGRLASAPVITLPIARLIKQATLPKSNAVHIAEVFMSGLLKVSGTQAPTFENAERVAYALVNEEVRDRLRAGLAVGEAFDVFQQVSNYVAQGLGKSVSEFWALLRTPTRGTSAEETAFLDAFATVTAKILRGLGGEFEAIANTLAPRAIESQDSTEETDNFPLEDLEYEAAQFINFPPLQTCEYQAATITAILDRFDCETATLTRQNRLLGLRQEWVINRRRAATWGYTEPLGTQLDNTIGLDMIAIPGGSFTMGAPRSEPESSDSERPQHKVTLPPFYLGRYAITQSQWRVVASYDRIDRDLDPDPSRFKGGNRPVENVSWDDAQEFCQRLAARTGKDYRLPSEAEWEYACRASPMPTSGKPGSGEVRSDETTTPFYFGETVTTELVNYRGTETYNNSPKGDYRQKTTAVGSFPANDWGLYDMHGNVWEWCEDDYHGSYEGAPDDGSAWVDADRTETNRLLRGGSWSGNPGDCRSAHRLYPPRDYRNINFGFRVCCVPPRALLSP